MMRFLRWFLPLIFVTSLAHAQTGYIMRDDCTTLTAVAYNTICQNTGSGGTLTQGTLYTYGTAGWEAVDTSSTPSLQNAKDTGATITNAVDTTTGVRTGNGIVHWNDFCDSSNLCRRQITDSSGTRVRGDYVVEVETNKTFILRDEELDAAMWTIDPDAASANAMYTIASGYRPLKSIYWDAGGINVDASNCTTPTEQALNSAEKTWAFSCADSNSSIFGGKVRMPVAYDGGTVTFTLTLFHGTTETITFAGDFSAQCRAAGAAINSTYGTAVAADVSITTANLIAEATTAAVTPNGTCTGGGVTILWRYVVDAANFSANAANSKVLGVTMKYNVSSFSD